MAVTPPEAARAADSAKDPRRLVTIIVPAYNEEANLPELRRRLGARRDEAGSNDAAVELLVELLGRHATNAALLGDAGRE